MWPFGFIEKCWGETMTNDQELRNAKRLLKEAQTEMEDPRHSEEKKLEISKGCAYYRHEINKIQARISKIRKASGAA